MTNRLGFRVGGISTSSADFRSVQSGGGCYCSSAMKFRRAEVFMLFCLASSCYGCSQIRDATEDEMLSRSTSGSPAFSATRLGGSGIDDCDDVALDKAGNLYLACHSESRDFAGAEPPANHESGDMDAYVTKFDPTTGEIVYSTRLGGSAWDGAFAIEVAASGNVVVAGFTQSPDFATTKNGVQPIYGGGESDAFLVQLSSDGAVKYSTFLGGSGTEHCSALAIDEQGRVYIGGTTWSGDFPGAEQSGRKNGVEGDAFVAAWDPKDSRSLAAMYVGGSKNEKITGISLASDGQFFISGFTESPDFPTQNAFQARLKGARDAFLAKVSLWDEDLIFSTFVGGRGEDFGWGVATDLAGSPYLAGTTNSPDFPTTTGSLQPGKQGNWDAFVAKFDAQGRAILYSTYLGGSGDDMAGYDGGVIALDHEGNTLLVGRTNSTDFPTRSPLQSAFGGGDVDGFVALIDSQGALRFSSYLGGSGRDLAEGLALDTKGAAWITGLTNSPTLPIEGLSSNRFPLGEKSDAFAVRVPPLSSVERIDGP